MEKQQFFEQKKKKKKKKSTNHRRTNVEEKKLMTVVNKIREDIFVLAKKTVNKIGLLTKSKLTKSRFVIINSKINNQAGKKQFTKSGN